MNWHGVLAVIDAEAVKKIPVHLQIYGSLALVALGLGLVASLQRGSADSTAASEEAHKPRAAAARGARPKPAQPEHGAPLRDFGIVGSPAPRAAATDPLPRANMPSADHSRAGMSADGAIDTDGHGEAGSAAAQARAEQLKIDARADFNAANYREAVRKYRRATRLASRDAGAYAGLGGSLLQLGQPERALNAYRRAIRLAPEQSGFHAALGRAYYLMAQPRKSRAAYHRAAALDPDNEAAQAALAQLNPQ